ncbi:MAG: thiol-disulfide oxidoreductase DCC family protein [Chitinophagaceae bacterium]|nr:thiol-disulfide oxidoreductase DCC family protein [Chitinophagaceae bacterium]
MEDKTIILFDGVCNLCNGFVNFVIRHDKRNQFMFAPLQSEIGDDLLKKFDVTEKLSTIVLIEKNKLFNRSTAVLKIMKKLSAGWKWFYALIIIPKFIRDAFYKLIAKNRYHWFGRKEECMVPTSEIKSKFLNYKYEKENVGIGCE